MSVGALITWPYKAGGHSRRGSPKAGTTVLSGLDIGYVPAGPHAFLRLSGQFGPPQFIFHWPEGPVFFVLFFCCASYAAIILLGIGKTRKATLIPTYFSLYIGLMYKSLQLHA